MIWFDLILRSFGCSWTLVHVASCWYICDILEVMRLHLRSHRYPRQQILSVSGVWWIIITTILAPACRHDVRPSVQLWGVWGTDSKFGHRCRLNKNCKCHTVLYIMILTYLHIWLTLEKWTIWTEHGLILFSFLRGAYDSICIVSHTKQTQQLFSWRIQQEVCVSEWSK